jgi:predicted O-linked N-acetylglucosamine transferase (SPINDLY family)
MSRRTPNAPKLTPVQRQQLHQKLASVMQSIQAGQLQHANAALTPILRKHPALPEVNHVAAGLSAAMNENDRALYYAQRAAQLAPDTAEYLAGLGSVLLKQDKHEQAIDAFTRALTLAPDLTDIRVPLATAQMQAGHINDARQTFRAVLDANPAHLEAANNLALLESDLAHADRAIDIINQALTHHPEHPMLLDALCMFACYSDTLSPDEVAAIHQRFGKAVESRVRPQTNHTNTPDLDRRIRVAFVSPDLRTHSIAYFIQPIIEHLDRSRFEVHLYHTAHTTDAMSERLRASCDRWHACTQGIAQTHKQIAADAPDILVELNGHFAANLLPMFAAKPAPVSVTMIGYANTTGLSTIDARIIDDTTDPAPQSDAWATESLVRVPGCFLCYRPPADAPTCKDPDPARPFTFGSFNDLRKMSPSCIQTWADILTQCPEARLVLKTARLGQHAAREDLLERFAARNIDTARIELLATTPTVQDHLDLYNQIDCALDTFPYTGTTTTCEAMHMGVPTVTLLGQSHAGRVSASLMHATDTQDWIAQSPEQYTQRAIAAHQQGPRSAQDRRSLREQLAASPLCDEPAYASKIADAFQNLWQRWCATKGAN